jgi:hypothetical protein
MAHRGPKGWQEKNKSRRHLLHLARQSVAEVAPEIVAKQSTYQSDAGTYRDKRETVAERNQGKIPESRPTASGNRTGQPDFGIVAVVAHDAEGESYEKHADELENHTENRHESTECDANHGEDERDEEGARRENGTCALAERRISIGRARRALLTLVRIGRAVVNLREEFIDIAGFRALAVSHTETGVSSGMSFPRAAESLVTECGQFLDIGDALARGGYLLHALAVFVRRVLGEFGGCDAVITGALVEITRE